MDRVGLTNHPQHYKYHLHCDIQRHKWYGRLRSDERCYCWIYKVTGKAADAKGYSGQCCSVSCALLFPFILFEERRVSHLPHRPGPVYTPIQVDTRAPEEMEDFGAGSSIGRPGQPSEVATSFVFLASSDASLYCMYSRLHLKIG